MSKKDMNYYMSLPYRIEAFPDYEKGGYAASVPDLPGCITYAETWEELGDMIEDAKRSRISTSFEDGTEIPEPTLLAPQTKKKEKAIA